ncbi:MAG: DUF4381 domain-containing protein [Pyrinomonadaceae bacterium]|nr:DUF4381 domain-containing protein [Pyrinomonadaceae bacterium]MCX7639766.1 DUF4381 domain-containing protein [Pyrinomonadaceae bacterium]MDW8304349.1 hypothetical protein [Acidobacteriota bacterium]
MKHFLNNIELILSGVGLIVIFAIPKLFFPESVSWWQVAGITAIIVGLLHGVIFWIIRRRQRKVRQEAIEEIRGMLQEVINNQLTSISLSTAGLEVQRVKRISESVSRISELIGTLSEESITNWKKKYSDVIESLKRVDEL